jgi:intein/homing endonuclease/predicted nucleic acid-binding Zn finger protein/TolA-binding protein
MAETERITVAEVSEDPPVSDTGGDPGEAVSLPVVELLTGRGFITGKSGAGKSILEGTPVYTDSGRKPIENVERGETVLSLNKHTYEQEFCEVQATIEHTDDRLLRVTLEDGTELVGTEDHSFLTADGLEIVPVRGDELEEGMWMPTARSLPSTEEKREIDLGEYVGEANNVVIEGDTIRSGPRTEDRRLTLDFQTGKEIGLYLAEGSFDNNDTLQIANIADGVHTFLEKRGYNVYEKTCNKGFQPYARFLQSEFGSGSAGKRLPGWVFEAREPFRAGLLSGYFDGDGTVGEADVTAMTKSETLLDGLRELLRQFGVSTTVREKFTFYDGDKRRYQRLTVDSFAIDRFAEVVDLSVSTKADRLESLRENLEEGEQYNSKDMIPNFGPVLNAAAREAGWTTRENERRNDGASVHHLTRKQKAGRDTYQRLVDELDIGGRAKAFGESDIQWKRIVSIEPLDDQRRVYDLDVELNDNFLANGVFVHNSNTASVFVEKLLDNGFGLLIVDIDGEYYGLKEEYEILHAGADEECDVQITADHAEKMATLALEKNVPIILDVSSFLDESEAEAVLTEIARHLFAKAKKQKQPFLVLVEEVHEYIPENGSVGECGKMLIKIGKRGRKHGLGIVGISQRPADVKKDFITQCDWLVWHRLTWDNDTNVVRRVLDGEYAGAVEDLDDGEGFLMTDWSESVRRVQFQRKRTFDAGATPGLEDFERPELKSVSDDLVSELEEITEQRQEHEDRIAELREELDRKNSRIAELERELRDARDLQGMADQFVEAMVGHVGGAAPGRTERERMRDTTRAEGTDELDATEADTEDREQAVPAGAGTGPDTDFSADDILERLQSVDTREVPDAVADSVSTKGRPAGTGNGSQAGTANGTRRGTDSGNGSDGDAREERAPEDIVEADGDETEYGILEESSGTEIIEEPIAVRELKAEIAGWETTTRRMLSVYRERGPTTPPEAHAVAGGDGDRTAAYAHNRQLRTRGLIEHAGRGHYEYRLRELLDETFDGHADEEQIETYARRVEDNALGPGVEE